MLIFSIFKNINFRSAKLLISIFVLLNIIFIAFISSGSLFKSTAVNAAHNCTLRVQHPFYFASIEVKVIDTNPSIPIPNAANLAMHTDQCNDGWDNGLPWASGYNSNLQEPLLQSPDITPGSYITPSQVAAFYKEYGYAPNTYQVMPDISVGTQQTGGTIYTCPSNTICSELPMSSEITRSVSSSEVDVSYLQLIDCDYSPVSYTLQGLPSGWNVVGNNQTADISNGPSVPVYTITVTPPKAASVSVSINCQNVSWNVSGWQSGDTLLGYIYDTVTDKKIIIPVQQTSSGSYALPSGLTSGNPYVATLWLYAPDQTILTSGSSSPLLMSSCQVSLPAPTISGSLSCSGISWSTTNFVQGDLVEGFVVDQNTNTHVFNLPAQSSASGSYSWTQDNSQDNYVLNLFVVVPNVNTTNVYTSPTSFNFYNCVSHVTSPVLNTVNLSCISNTYNMEVSWTYSNLNSSDEFYGELKDLTNPTDAPISFMTSASNGSYTLTGISSRDNYIAVGSIQGNHGISSTVTSSSANISTCQIPLVQLTSVSLACVNNTTNNLAITWNAESVSSGDTFQGEIRDVTTNQIVGDLPSGITLSQGQYVWGGANGKDSYTVSGWAVNANAASGNVVTSSAVSSNCIPQQVVTPTVSTVLGCQGVSWTVNNLGSDTISGYITDTSTGTKVFAVPSSTSSNGSAQYSNNDSHDNYQATINVLDSNGNIVSTANSSNFNFYDCVSHTTPPVLNTVSLSCVSNTSNMQISWTDSNVNSSDEFYGELKDVTNSSSSPVKFSILASNGVYTINNISNNDDYEVVGYINGNHGTSSSVTSSTANISTCQVPTVQLSSVSLSCVNNTTNNLAITWKAESVSSSDIFAGKVTDANTNQVVAELPSGILLSQGEYVWGGANGKDSYTVSGWAINSQGKSGNTITSSSVSSNCIPASPTVTVVLGCQGASWTAINLGSTNVVSGEITDTSNNSVVATIPSSSSTVGNYSYSNNNSHDNYEVALNIKDSFGNIIFTAYSNNFNFYNCVSHVTPPVLNTVTLSCISNTSNMQISWTDSNVNSSDEFYGELKDVTNSSSSPVNFSILASNGVYTINNVSNNDDYEVVGYINGNHGTSSSVTSSTANISTCQVPTVQLSSVSLSCVNNTTNNLVTTWQAQGVTNNDNISGKVTDTTTNQVVADIPSTPVSQGSYIWTNGNGKDSYTVTLWIINASGGSNIGTKSTVSVSDVCIPPVITTSTPPTTPVLPQTAGSSPINFFVIAGSVLTVIGIGLMLL